MPYDNEIDQILSAVETIDSVLSEAAGQCKVLGTAIRVSTGFLSPEYQKSIIEHEQTHRSDITGTTYGNLINLVHLAKQSASSFDKERREFIDNILEKMPFNRFKICLEGHATLTQKFCLKRIPEKNWIAKLKKHHDKAYFNGYLLASEIMSYFNVRDEAYLSLTDILMWLPLNVDWYPNFGTIERAHEFLSRINEDDYPDKRLTKLVKCFKNISDSNPFLFEQISTLINRNVDPIIRDAYQNPIHEKTWVGDRYITNKIYPTGRNLFAYISKLINGNLKVELEKEGFLFADIGTASQINSIVNQWNRQTVDGAKKISVFTEATATSVKSLNMSFGAIDRKRGITLIGPKKIEKKIRKHIEANSQNLIIARYYHVHEPDGWKISKTKSVPYGSWYLVFAFCDHGKLGKKANITLSPQWHGLTQFDQYYMLFENFSRLPDFIPINISNLLWLTPDPNPQIYQKNPDLKSDWTLLLQYHKTQMPKGSKHYCAMMNNDLGSINQRLTNHKFTEVHYDETSGFCRLWTLIGDIDYVFSTSIDYQINNAYVDQITQITGIEPVQKTSTKMLYLAQWLGTDEGF